MTVGRSLNVAVWNLAWPMLAIAACGPVVATGEGGSTEGSTSAETNPDIPEGGPECFEAMDCGYGYACVDGFCEYQCYCGCGAEPPRDDRFRCSEVGGYDCYADQDCGEGEICEAGFCTPDPDPPCADIPSFSGELEIAFAAAPSTIRSLRFADVEQGGAAELVGVADTTVFRVQAELAVPIIAGADSLIEVVAGDIDGDGAIDLVTSSAALVQVWRNEGELVPLGDGTVVIARQLAITDTDADGWNEVVLLEEGGGVWRLRNEGGGVLSERQTWGGFADHIGIVDVEQDGNGDVVLENDGAISIVQGPSGTTLELGSPTPSAAQGIHGGDFDGDGRDDLVVVDFDGFVTSWLGSVLDHSPHTSSIMIGTIATATGDIDGDGRLDLVIGRTDGAITIRFGASARVDVGTGEPFACEHTFAVTTTPAFLAVGDYDGDGTTEIASSDGSHLRVLTRNP
ncbi:MAG TPA: VCBS repeat-containing protein [Nannocystaceae bacterium]|nr:VCBS repeat-containing protein [Nannocystaceae bacterium]